MKLSQASYQYVDGRPEIHLTIDGAPARINLEQKPFILDRGYIVLAPALEWEMRLPAVEIPADPQVNRGPLTIRGALYSPELVLLYRKMVADLKAGRFDGGKELPLG
jgi:hypothetical protein